MTNNSKHIRVTFKQSDSKLVSMFAEKFYNAMDAKEAIKEDARKFAEVHGGKVVNVDPETMDYFEVNGSDGVNCVWQWFS